MTLPTVSTNASYARPQQTGGVAGQHPVTRDQGRGVAPACSGGTCGDSVASVDAKKHAAAMAKSGNGP